MRFWKPRTSCLVGAVFLALAAVPTTAQPSPDPVRGGAIRKSPGTAGFVGIGVMLDPRPSQDGFPVVRRTIQSAGADAKAVLGPGDKITRVDGKPVRNASISRVVELLRGEEGKTVRLTLLRPGATKPVEVTVKRCLIRAVGDDSAPVSPTRRKEADPVSGPAAGSA